MQHRYAGDIGDYLKLAILRKVSKIADVAVLWWLHPDEDHNGDGGHVSYLRAPEKWRSIDPELFDALNVLMQRKVRSLAGLEHALLPGAFTFDRNEVPTGTAGPACADGSWRGRRCG